MGEAEVGPFGSQLASDSGAPVGVAVLGLGLVGGSLARDLAAAGVRVVGWDRDPPAMAAAVRAGVAREAPDPARPGALDGCDVVVLAVPVDAAPELLERVAAGLAAGAVITDVGSTKRAIMAAARNAGLGERFVGSHPMAGSHESGWHASRQGLFVGARVWVCPGEARAEAVDRISALWRSVGALPEPTDAGAHDHSVAWASHLPQVTASALAAVLRAADIPESALGPGGRDMTRLAASDPDLWTGIAATNADQLAPAVRELADRLTGLVRSLDAGDRAAVRSWFERRSVS